MKVFISGLESGSNSASGIGLARAIRRAYPNVRLVGVSYAQAGVQIQWPDFDEQWNVGPWHTVDFADHQRKIEERLADGAWWISGIPSEVRWLAQTSANHGHVLVPPMLTLESIRLPAIPLATDLGASVPASILATASDWNLNTFGRRHGWRVWLRPQDHPGQRIHSWHEFQQARREFGENTCSDAAFLQEHIEGTPESLAFAAHNGELLSCALYVSKKPTSNGEWAVSRIEEVPAPFVASLAQTLAMVQWTGGGTLSLMRDHAGRRWVLGWQAAFPNWIFGAALAGINLPAQLLERATGESAIPLPKATQEFARVVIEMPLHRTEGTQSIGPRSATERDSAPQQQASTISARSDNVNTVTPQISDTIAAEVHSAAFEINETPAWLFLPGAAREAFIQAKDLMRRFSTPEIQVQVAYSVKTNPDRRLLELARASGLLAETISQSEVKKALACGIPAERIIMNGPAKRWPAPDVTQEPLGAVFCDSLEELRTAIAASTTGGHGIYQAKILGIRLRPSQFASRFGIPIETPESIEMVSALVRQLPAESRFGIHFQMASNSIGIDRWWQLFNDMLDSTQAIEATSGRRVTCLDIGGGWFPDDWTQELSPHFEEQIIGRVTRSLPHVRELFLEPGRALAQSSMALAMRVLEVRREANGRIGDVVVDGSIAELAYHNYTIFPHRILWYDSIEQRWRPVGRGTGRILGRLCMEKDILAEALDVPDSLAAGDLLVFCDAGAYDRSMSYTFGQG